MEAISAPALPAPTSDKSSPEERIEAAVAALRDRVARDLLEATPDYDGELRRIPSSELSTSAVFDAFDRRDPIARHVLDDAVQYWAMATANLVSVFNPETIVFGGGVFGPAVRFLDRIRDEARQWAQPIAMQQVRLVASTLGGDAGLYGAARLAMTAFSRGQSR